MAALDGPGYFLIGDTVVDVYTERESSSKWPPIELRVKKKAAGK